MYLSFKTEYDKGIKNNMEAWVGKHFRLVIPGEYKAIHVKSVMGYYNGHYRLGCVFTVEREPETQLLSIRNIYGGWLIVIDARVHLRYGYFYPYQHVSLEQSSEREELYSLRHGDNYVKKDFQVASSVENILWLQLVETKHDVWTDSVVQVSEGCQRDTPFVSLDGVELIEPNSRFVFYPGGKQEVYFQAIEDDIYLVDNNERKRIDLTRYQFLCVYRCIEQKFSNLLPVDASHCLLRKMEDRKFWFTILGKYACFTPSLEKAHYQQGIVFTVKLISKGKWGLYTDQGWICNKDGCLSLSQNPPIDLESISLQRNIQRFKTIYCLRFKNYYIDYQLGFQPYADRALLLQLWPWRENVPMPIYPPASQKSTSWLSADGVDLREASTRFMLYTEDFSKEVSFMFSPGGVRLLPFDVKVMPTSYATMFYLASGTQFYCIEQGSLQVVTNMNKASMVQFLSMA